MRFEHSLVYDVAKNILEKYLCCGLSLQSICCFHYKYGEVSLIRVSCLLLFQIEL